MKATVTNVSILEARYADKSDFTYFKAYQTGSVFEARRRGNYEHYAPEAVSVADFRSLDLEVDINFFRGGASVEIVAAYDENGTEV